MQKAPVLGEETGSQGGHGHGGGWQHALHLEVL